MNSCDTSAYGFNGIKSFNHPSQTEQKTARRALDKFSVFSRDPSVVNILLRLNRFCAFGAGEIRVAELSNFEVITVKQSIYLLWCIAGIAIPYSQLISFVRADGINGALFLQQMFANHISTFFAVDVVVSAAALCTFVFIEGRRLKMTRLWIYVVSTLLVGVSLALPLFLLIRQIRLDRDPTYSDK